MGVITMNIKMGGGCDSVGRAGDDSNLSIFTSPLNVVFAKDL